MLIRSLMTPHWCWRSIPRISPPTTQILVWRRQSTQPQAEQDQPIRYTKSKAFKYLSSESFGMKAGESSYPEYTSVIIKVSFSIFLIYFCWLREPNDIDQLLSKDLFDVMPDLEVPMLEAEIKRLEAHGLNTAQLKQKVEEIRQLKETKKQLTSK